MSLSTFPVKRAEFVVDGVLFDMDGTLTDSIKAVEAAWGSVAVEIGRDPQEVIDLTHGRRAIDNLRDLKPHLRRLSTAEMEPHVEAFETKILDHADEYQIKVASLKNSPASSRASSRRSSMKVGFTSADEKKETLQKALGLSMTSVPRRASSSLSAETALSDGSFNFSDGSSPALTRSPSSTSSVTSGVSTSGKSLADSAYEEVFDEEDVGVEDKSVKILPGVKRMINAIPEGRYAVATSGAKTYCHGALSRVGIEPPEITVTADDKRLRRGKPYPDPFILAAKGLGFEAKNCLVVEDSPSGIRAGVASGATTIAVCTSHPVEKIDDCGAHYVVPSLDVVHVYVQEDGRIRIVIDGNAPVGASAAVMRCRHRQLDSAASGGDKEGGINGKELNEKLLMKTAGAGDMKIVEEETEQELEVAAGNAGVAVAT